VPSFEDGAKKFARVVVVGEYGDRNLSNAFSDARRRVVNGNDVRVNLAFLLTKRLDLSNNSCLSEEELMILAGFGKGLPFPFLEEVDVQNSNVSDRFIDALSLVAPNLLRLNLNGNPLVTDSALVMLALRCKSLEEIKISSCAALTGRGIAFALKSFGSKTKSLDLKGISSLDDACVSALCLHCPNLETLSISGTCVNEEGVLCILSHCLSLKRLELSGLPISSATITRLSALFNSIEYIDISFCAGLSANDIQFLIDSFPNIELRAFGLDLAGVVQGDSCALIF
jgi:ABC-type transporter Mla MlaB component